MARYRRFGQELAQACAGRGGGDGGDVGTGSLVSSTQDNWPAFTGTGCQLSGGGAGRAAPEPTQRVPFPWHFSADSTRPQRMPPLGSACFGGAVDASGLPG